VNFVSSVTSEMELVWQVTAQGEFVFSRTAGSSFSVTILLQDIKASGYHNMTTCVFLVADSLFLSTVHTRPQGHFWPIRKLYTTINFLTYEGCREGIRPFWISREPVMWPWCNLAASQRRPYCASVSSYPPVRLVSQQWHAVDWACVLCERRIRKFPPFQRQF